MFYHMIVWWAQPTRRALFAARKWAERLYSSEFHATKAKTTQNPTKTLTHPYK
jgi:hypothetical protein